MSSVVIGYVSIPPEIKQAVAAAIKLGHRVYVTGENLNAFSCSLPLHADALQTEKIACWGCRESVNGWEEECPVCCADLRAREVLS